MEKIIELNGIDINSFLGPQDQNIKLIEDAFASKIIVRDNRIKVLGKKDNVQLSLTAIDSITSALNTKGSLTRKDVSSLLNIISRGDIDFNKNLDYQIMFGSKGAICARTKGQKDYYNIVKRNDVTFSIGPAGTGKTFMAVAFAVSALTSKEVDRIVLCRPAVEAGENLGFLPGDLKEKVDPYLAPFYDSLGEMISISKYKPLIADKVIEIIPLAFMRGRTLNNAFMILDEAQNATKTQMKMFLTRLGNNSKAIITGDITQIDLPNNVKSGLVEVVDLLKNIDGIGFAHLTSKDVVRHKLVREIIDAYEAES
jgi:phosphate starvation-inducible PhoH-like protein